MRGPATFALRPVARFGGADAALALLVISIVAMMIVPLPTWLLDVLIATNLSAAVAILLVVLYVPDALAASMASANPAAAADPTVAPSAASAPRPRASSCPPGRRRC